MLKSNKELSGLGKVIWLALYIAVAYLVIWFVWEVLGWWYLAIVVGFALWWGNIQRREEQDHFPPNREDRDGQQT